MKYRFSKLGKAFDVDHRNFWSHLSRVNNMMVIMNISMFFLTGLVTTGYFYTFYSLGCAAVVGMGILVPTTLIRRLFYYWIFLIIEFLGFYYLAASVIYWVNTSS